MTPEKQFALVIGLFIPVMVLGVLVSLFEIFEIERESLKSPQQIKRD